MPNIPGLSLSILRQDTVTQAGKPVLVSGRFTGFGLGLPAFIRVALQGPSYNPEVRNFDTIASPFSGDYAVQVLAEKDGQYTLKAAAIPMPLVPTGPAFPEPLLLLPPVAESTEPPLVVGQPTTGGISVPGPGGQGSQLVPTPPKTDIEISVGAPGVTITFPGAPGRGAPALPGLPPFPGLPTPGLPTPTPGVPTPTPGVPTPTPAPAPPPPGFPTVLAASMLGTPALTLPSQVTVGQPLTGSIGLPTTIPAGLPTAGLPTYSVAWAAWLSTSATDPTAAGYFLGQGTSNIRLGDRLSLPLSANTASVPPGAYNVWLAVHNGQNYIFRQVIGRITLLAGAPAGGFPDALAANMLGTPALTLPSQVTVGQPLTGAIGLPTTVPSLPPGTPTPTLPTYSVAWAAWLSTSATDPTAAGYFLGQGTSNIRLGDRLSLPLSANTASVPPGAYNVWLAVHNGQNYIFSRVIGQITLVAAPGVPPPPFVWPTVPTPQMLGVPALTLPAQLTVGQPLTGAIGLPTTVPSLPPGTPTPTLPTYSVAWAAWLSTSATDPTAAGYFLGQGTSNIRLGDRLSLPLSANTASVPPGAYNVWLAVHNGQNYIFRQVIGQITLVAAPGVPPPPFVWPTVPTPQMLGVPAANLPQQLDIGQPWVGSVTVPTVVPTLPAGTPVPPLPAYPFDLGIALEDPAGQRYALPELSQSVTLGQPLTLPVNMSTEGFAEGRYNVWLEVGSQGTVLFANIIRQLYLMTPEVPPPVEVPPLPTADMLGTPSLSLPTTVDYGQPWSGSIQFPTSWPAELPMPPTLPTYSLSVLLTLRAVSGQDTPAVNWQPAFQPGQSLDLPVAFDTGQLPGPGVYEIFVQVWDAQGNELFGAPAGLLSIESVAPPPPPPPPPAPTTYNLTIEVFPASAGYVVPSSGQYASGPITLAAVPLSPRDINYQFTYWYDYQGAQYLYDNPLTIDLNGDRYIIAYFIPEVTSP